MSMRRPHPFQSAKMSRFTRLGQCRLYMLHQRIWINVRSHPRTIYSTYCRQRKYILEFSNDACLNMYASPPFHSFKFFLQFVSCCWCPYFHLLILKVCSSIVFIATLLLQISSLTCSHAYGLMSQAIPAVMAKHTSIEGCHFEILEQPLHQRPCYPKVPKCTIDYSLDPTCPEPLHLYACEFMLRAILAPFLPLTVESQIFCSFGMGTGSTPPPSFWSFKTHHVLIRACDALSCCTYTYELMSQAIPAPSAQQVVAKRQIVLKLWNGNCVNVHTCTLGHSKMYT
jgi:hypothetical protein